MIKVILAVLALLGVQKQCGYVVEKTLEGGSGYNDYYIVNLGGELYEVEADDLEEGDAITCYFANEEEVVRTLYEWR